MYRLMIVDDSSIIRRQIERACAGTNFALSAVAGDGKEAVAMFRRHHPHVVTMDLTMPRMDGLACIQTLVEIDPDVHILVISALSDKATGIRALQLGAEGFVCKPFSDKQLTEALNELVQE